MPDDNKVETDESKPKVEEKPPELNAAPPEVPSDPPKKEPDKARPVEKTKDTATDEKTINARDVSQQQQKRRGENQDQMRVWTQFVGLGTPYINVEGDWVMGSRSGGYAGDVSPLQRDSAQVTKKEIEKIIQVYQRHAAFPVALKLFKQHPCIVLRGKPDVGKRAAAIRLAVELFGNDVNIWELSPEQDPAVQMGMQPLKSGTVYLIHDLLRDRGHEFKRLDAQAMVGTLEKHGCHLVICVKPDVEMPSVLPDVMLEPLPVPTFVLVEEHLKYYEDLSFERIDDAFNNLQIKELLEGGLPPILADRLASKLAVCLMNDEPPENALRGFAAASENDVRHWLDETADNIDESAFRISLAVFRGTRYDDVESAARELVQLFIPPEIRKEEHSKYNSPLKRPRRTIRLQEARAHLVTRDAPTEYSEKSTLEVVELNDPGYSSALLKYLWIEIDEWRKPLLDWLGAHAIEGRSEMRLRAAGAIGALAGLDFEYIRRHVFLNWAYEHVQDDDERRSYYQALANAFGVLIWNDERREEALGLLSAWAGDKSEPLRWAAARAYTQVGLRYPREAINQWRRILESEGMVEFRLTESYGLFLPHPLHVSVINAVLALFYRATEFPHRLRPVYEQAIEGLAEWIDRDAKEKRAEQLGLPLFLLVTEIGRPPGPDEPALEPDDWQPAMLYVINTQPDSQYRRTLAGLLRRALKHQNLLISQWTVLVLQSWLKHAKKDAWLEEALTALLRELLELEQITEGERNRLAVLLTRAASHPREPLAVAARISDTLNLH